MTKFTKPEADSPKHRMVHLLEYWGVINHSGGSYGSHTLAPYGHHAWELYVSQTLATTVHHKRVFLRDRKRLTARGIAVLTLLSRRGWGGSPCHDQGGVPPFWLWWYPLSWTGRYPLPLSNHWPNEPGPRDRTLDRTSNKTRRYLRKDQGPETRDTPGKDKGPVTKGYPLPSVSRQTSWKHYLPSYFVRGR